MNSLFSRVKSCKLATIAFVFAALAFLFVFYGMAINNTPESNAVSALDFKAGRIIDDEVFYNPDTMTVAEIQAHLDKYSANCDMWGTNKIGYGRYINGRAVDPNITRREYARLMREAGRTDYHDAPYVCISKYYENPTTHKTNFDTNAQPEEGMFSAAQIIYNAAHEYSINPQVLLVMLKKESYVWGDTWPLKNEYNTVMGYACPDNAPCDSAYFGFYNQVMKAAWQLKYYKEHIYSYGYYPYMTNNIYYSPNYACGTKAVYLENIATTSLYIYTPYTPNDAALANYPGEAYCGSYGNRNFFMYFSEWFGSTYYSDETGISLMSKANLSDEEYYIGSFSDSSKDLQLLTNDSLDGTKISILARNNVGIESFVVNKNTDETYTITNSISNKAIDVPAAEAKEGQILQQFEPNGTSAQKWYIYNNFNGSYVIASALDKNLVVTIKDNELVLSRFSELSDQAFSFIPSVQPIEDGLYTITSTINKAYAIDVSGGYISQNGSNVQLFVGNYTLAQQWILEFDTNTGFYSVKTKAGKFLDVSKAGTTDGTNIQIWDQNNSCTQAWRITKDRSGRFSLFNECSDKALDLSGGILKNSSNIQIWTPNDTAAQKWNITKFEESNEIPNGTYVIRNAGNQSYVIDVTGAIFADATNIQLYAFNNTNAQKWMVTYHRDGDYYLIRTALGNKYLSVKDASISSGANVRLWSNVGYCAQKWNVRRNTDGTYRIKSSCSDKVLDVSGAIYRNGTNIQIWEDNSTSAQKWLFY